MNPLPRIIGADWNKFWGSVSIGFPDECWPWGLSCYDDGYGMFYLRKQNLRAHRVAFYVANGFDPYPLLVLHRCDNPPCCNPAHLFGGTTADNAEDRCRKGRQAKGVSHGMFGRPPSNPIIVRYGLDHPLARFSPELIDLMRKQYATGSITQRELAAQHDISCSYLSRVLRGEKRCNG